MPLVTPVSVKKKAPHLAWDPKDCRLMPNPDVRDCTPFWLSPNNGPVTLDPAVGTDVIFTNDKSGLYELIAFVASSTSSDFTVKFTDDSAGRPYGKNPLHAITVAGSANFPYYLPHPIYMLPGETVTTSLFNLSAAINTINILFYCKKYKVPGHVEQIFGPDWLYTVKNTKPSFYTTDQVITIPIAGGSATGFFTITEESDFYLRKITDASLGTYEVKIINNKTQDAFSNDFIPSNVFAGDAPFWQWSYPEGDEIFLENRTLMEFLFHDTSGAPNRIHVTFAGINYYYERKPEHK